MTVKGCSWNSYACNQETSAVVEIAQKFVVGCVADFSKWGARKTRDGATQEIGVYDVRCVLC